METLLQNYRGKWSSKVGDMDVRSRGEHWTGLKLEKGTDPSVMHGITPNLG